jgi:ABC-type transport system substrate-binding protein
LLAGAGWTPGTDGVLVNGQTGERFELEIRGKQGGDIDREMGVIADYWKAVGVQMSIVPIPPALQSNREYNAAYPGMLVAGPPANRVYEDRYHSRNIAGPANDWTGTNRFGYRNPAVDTILDQLTVALDPRERVAAHQQLVKVMMGDIGIMPLSWEVVPVLAVKGVKTHKVADNNATWDMFTWDRE